MDRNLLISNLFVALTLVVSMSSHAALYDRGNGLIYDDVLNITWLRNANYAQTSGYDEDGRMTWEDAKAWADTLVYAGYSDWRLPSVRRPEGFSSCYSPDGACDRGWNITSSELGYMFYVNLGNIGKYDTSWNLQAGYGLTNTSFTDASPGGGITSFLGIQEDTYWYDEEYPEEPSNAYAFATHPFDFGAQELNHKDFGASAWAVRDGDVGALPAGYTYDFGFIGAEDGFSGTGSFTVSTSENLGTGTTGLVAFEFTGLCAGYECSFDLADVTSAQWSVDENSGEVLTLYFSADGYLSEIGVTTQLWFSGEIYLDCWDQSLPAGPGPCNGEYFDYRAETYPGVETYVTLREIQVEQDQDQDGVFDVDDNCPAIFNADQLNTDSADDGGDACDEDDDNDAWEDLDDNCPLVANNDQADGNGDGLGDACSISHNGYTRGTSSNIVTGGGLEWLRWDETVNQSAETALSNYAAEGWRLATNLQMARLLHSFFTFETVCNGGEVDPAEEVVCYEFATLHDDANSVGPANNFIALFGDNYKAAGHSYDFGDPVEMATAVYGDAGGNNVYVADVWDEYLWSDGNLSAGSAHLGQDTLMRDDSNGFNGVALVRPSFPIIDGDGDEVADYEDNCLSVPNTDQFNTDGADDGGNACDDNDDNDSLEDSSDNCPLLVNEDQADGDEDGIGDSCDLDFDNDGDGVPDNVDNCPAKPNPNQTDSDNDGIGNKCDNDYVPPGCG